MKIRKLIFFCVIIFSFGCVRDELVRDDISLNYMNYLSPDTIPSSFIDLFQEVRCDSFDVSFLKKTKPTLIKGNPLEYFFQKVEIFKYEYEREKGLYGFYWDKPFKMPKQTYQDILACGKIKIHKNVEGLILMFKSKVPSNERCF